MLRVWLPLNGDLHNQGCADVTVNNTGATVDNNGKIGKCYSFSSKALYGDIPNFNNYTQISGCCWVYLTNLNSAQYFIHCGGQSSYPCKFSIDYEGSVRFQINGTEYTSGITLTTNTWYHIAVTWNGTEAKLYVNGIERSTKNTSGTFNASNHFAIGARTNSTAGNAFAYYITSAGKINDVRIYDHCLSAAEVREISQGLVLHYKLDNTPQGEIINAYNMSSWDTSATRGGFSAWGPSGHSGTSGNNTDRNYIYRSDRTYSYYISEDAGTGKYFIFYQSPAFEGGYRSLSAIIKEQNGIPINETVCVPSWNANVTGSNYAPLNIWTRKISLGNGFYLCQVDGFYQNGSNDLVSINVLPGYKIYISEIWLEDNKQVCSNVLFPIEYIEDSSGYNHNGTITGTISIDSDSPRYQSSTYVNGSSYILTPAGSFAWNDLTQLTFSAWMKPTASMTGWRGSVGIAADANQTARGIAITDYANEFRGTYTNGSGYQTVATGKTLTQNEWHHCAGTLNGTEFKLYFDGVLVKTQTIDWGTATLNANARFEVGVDLPGTDEKFTGNYSDVRCYCTALDADAIRQLYEVGAKVDNKGNLHTFELNELSSNVFRSELIIPYAKQQTGSYGQWVERNDYDAIAIMPVPFYKNLENDESGFLCNEFIPNTQYIVDIWMDTELVMNGENPSSGGLYVDYTDGTSSGNILIANGGIAGWQHKYYITDINKSIKKLRTRYGVNKTVYFRSDSFIAPIQTHKITKTGKVITASLSENSDIYKIQKGGNNVSNEIIEL